VIKAPRGYRAVYSHEKPHAHTTTKDVVAFDDDGQALVLGDRGGLVPATSYTNFKDINEPGEYENRYEVEHMISGGGWMARRYWDDKESGKRVYADEPVVAWVVSPGMTLTPWTTDQEGDCSAISGDTTIWHPDESAPPWAWPDSSPADPPTTSQ
jgi:hypothetical protein